LELEREDGMQFLPLPFCLRPQTRRGIRVQAIHDVSALAMQVRRRADWLRGGSSPETAQRGAASFHDVTTAVIQWPGDINCQLGVAGTKIGSWFSNKCQSNRERDRTSSGRMSSPNSAPLSPPGSAQGNCWNGSRQMSWARRDGLTKCIASLMCTAQPHTQPQTSARRS
jgi:hypothetical protein